jgi:hypothetical protein
MYVELLQRVIVPLPNVADPAYVLHQSGSHLIVTPSADVLRCSTDMIHPNMLTDPAPSEASM